MDDTPYDPDIAARFEALQRLPAPDVRSRVTDVASVTRLRRPIAGQLAWAAVVVLIAVIGGVAALQYAPSSATNVDVGGPVDDDIDPPIPTDTPGLFDCPVTPVPDEPFVPPAPYNGTPSAASAVWYGSDELWTVLDVDGYVPRKSVWWSANFPGGGVEEQPPIEVVYERLDRLAEPIVYASPGTNANRADDGWFMINGIDPDDAGCWQVTATYKGATLTYVYEKN